MIHTTDNFRCKQYEPVYKSIEDAYLYDKPVTWNLGGGSASGKTVFVREVITFFLTEVTGEYAFIAVDTSNQKKKMLEMFESVLRKYGYSYEVNDRNGKISQLSFEGCYVIFTYAESKTIASVEEDFKIEYVEGEKIRFIWYEEFTAVMSTFRSVKVYKSIMSRLKRQCVKGHVIIHTYNPPDTYTNLVFDLFKGDTEIRTLISNIYEQPKKFQNEQTLIEAEKLRVENEMLWRNVYLGEVTGTGGLAYPYAKDSLTNDFDTYYKYTIAIDNGTDHATCFELHGYTIDGHIDIIDTWYHSGRVQGYKGSDEYLIEFEEQFTKWGVSKDTFIIVDSLDFSVMLDARGYNVAYAGKVIDKNNAEFLTLTRRAFERGILRIVNTPNNNITYKQFVNLETKTQVYKGRTKTICNKTEGRGVAEDRTMHAVDPTHYTIMFMQEELGLQI